MYMDVLICRVGPMPTIYSSNKARSHFKEVLDGAERAQTPIIERGRSHFAVIDQQALTNHLMATVVVDVQLVEEDGAFVLVMTGLPFASEATSIDEALKHLVLDLRDYAHDWYELFSNAPNHSDNWGLVTLISLLTDEELEAWLVNA